MKTVLFLLFCTNISYAACDLASVLIANYPNSRWTLEGPDYSGLKWYVNPIPMPTKAEMDKAIQDCKTAAIQTNKEQVQALLDVQNTKLKIEKRFQALLVLQGLN